MRVPSPSNFLLNFSRIVGIYISLSLYIHICVFAFMHSCLYIYAHVGVNSAKGLGHFLLSQHSHWIQKIPKISPHSCKSSMSSQMICAEVACRQKLAGKLLGLQFSSEVTGRSHLPPEAKVCTAVLPSCGGFWCPKSRCAMR